jgi:hypothetical protein
VAADRGVEPRAIGRDGDRLGGAKADWRHTHPCRGAGIRSAHLIPGETGKTFLAFVHELDPSVPAERAAYVNHRSFQAALYLKRLALAPHTQAKHRTTVSPFTLLAMVVRGALPHAQPHAASYWEEIRRASRWRDRDLERLKLRVEKVRAVPLTAQPRLVKRSTLRPVHAAVAADRGRR